MSLWIFVQGFGVFESNNVLIIRQWDPLVRINIVSDPPTVRILICRLNFSKCHVMKPVMKVYRALVVVVKRQKKKKKRERLTWDSLSTCIELSILSFTLRKQIKHLNQSQNTLESPLLKISKIYSTLQVLGFLFLWIPVVFLQPDIFYHLFRDLFLDPPEHKWVSRWVSKYR